MLLPNVKSATLGGNVFWVTLRHKNGWKLQQNVFTEHYRILDQNNIRHAWGTSLFELELILESLSKE